MSKLNTYLKWAGTNKKRWALAIGSVVILLLTLGFILFMLLSGFNSEEGLHKDPVKIKADIKVKTAAPTPGGGQ